MSEGFSSEAFCLHVRPYRETSVLVQLFTRQAGRISVVAKGIKSAKKSRSSQTALLQPFNSLQVTWVGKRDLKTLTQVELLPERILLAERPLLAGLYVNELLALLLPEHFEYGDLYECYRKLLLDFSCKKDIEPSLRIFERKLLEHLGYGISFCEIDTDGNERGDLGDSLRYLYQPEHGFLKTEKESGVNIFSGKNLIHIKNNNLKDTDVLLEAKKLMRLMLGHVLGGKVLNSRQLFL